MMGRKQNDEEIHAAWNGNDGIVDESNDDQARAAQSQKPRATFAQNKSDHAWLRPPSCEC
jgi:hypothetical protein